MSSFSYHKNKISYVLLTKVLLFKPSENDLKYLNQLIEKEEINYDFHYQSKFI